MSWTRRSASSGSPLEPEIGFARAVRVGPIVAVSGTAPLDPSGETHAPGDVYRQTRRCIAIMLDALAELGARPEDVVRTRVLLARAERWRDAARAHGEVFGAIRPACTFVAAAGFIDPAWLVETEADAVVAGD